MKVENKTPEIVFRRAVPADAPILTETRRRCWDATYRGIYPDEMIDNYDYSRHGARDLARISDPENTVWLAMDGESCVGYLYVGPCGYGPYKDFAFCLNSLYFLPDYQHIGLGGRAFALAAAECRRRGYKKFLCPSDSAPTITMQERSMRTWAGSWARNLTGIRTKPKIRYITSFI